MRRSVVVLAAVLASCTQRAREPEQRPTGGPALFETAFVEGSRARDPAGEVTFTRKRLGTLKITSGRIVACDPLVLDAPEPFTQAFPVGAAPVELAVARLGTDERVAFARLLFSERPVARWEPALVAGEDPAKLVPGEWGYGVDSGTGGFMDRDAAAALAKRLAADEKHYDAIARKLDETYRATWSAILWDVGDRNVAIFSSGFGDGQYATYVGYDASGGVARLLTDFDVVEWRPAAR